MTCYLPPCCNLSSSPIRQSPSLFLFLFRRPAALSLFTLFRYSAILGFFLRGSSTSARRTVKSQPLATSAEVPLSRVLPSSRRLIIHVFSPPPPLPSTPVLVFVHSRLLFSGVNLRSRKIANIDRTRPRIEREKDRKEDARAISERE